MTTDKQKEQIIDILKCRQTFNMDYICRFTAQHAINGYAFENSEGKEFKMLILIALEHMKHRVILDVEETIEKVKKII